MKQLSTSVRRQSAQISIIQSRQASQAIRIRPVSSNRIGSSELPEPVAQATEAPTVPDTRSPLERFRTQPRKALSVTDIVSPAWCELQYWYTLTKYGRKKATPAMRMGTTVHKQLEEQLYTTVKVDIETKEDSWGLRIWNVIQGLRTLRETGQTRELEIWGLVDGLPVNGVIDEISFVCPDADLEEFHRKQNGEEPELPADQSTISDFFKNSGGMSIANAARSKRRSKSEKIYLCDVKTRAARSLPNNTSFRPTKIQLMLYHHIMSKLATNNVDFSVVAARHGLNISTPFSDSFIAQIGNLNDQFYNQEESGEVDQDSIPGSSQDSMTMLLANNSLSELWSLMIMEFQQTLPSGKHSMGNVLKAEYRSPQGQIVGNKAFLMEEDVLQMYLQHEMKWWRGERPAEGVIMEEAYKCRSCDFADTCEWRLAKIDEAKEKSRASKKALLDVKKWAV